jgi:Protein of unknown function (DUF1706)
MNPSDPSEVIRLAYQTFRDVILSIPADHYLAPMNGWSPRDTVAHLVGWNRAMIEACQELSRGQTPAYYKERAIDYRDMNAGFVARYAAQDRDALLSELAESLDELRRYLSGLEPGDWEADHGVVHYRGGAATVARTITSLAGDYQHHAQEIRAWLDARGASLP